jgi:flagellar biosynthesis/type III secretory pathway protein FliH
MTYVTLINTPVLNIATDQNVINKDQVKCINDIHLLVNEIKLLRDEQLATRKLAEKEGFNVGYKEGLEKSLNDTKKQFSDYLIRTTEEINDKLTIQKNTIVQLAIEITKKIVTSMNSEEIVMCIVSNAIKFFREGEGLKVQINKVIANNIKEKIQAKYSHDNMSPNIEVIEDPNIDTLDCIITSEYGVTDASFKEQIKALERHLKKAL